MEHLHMLGPAAPTPASPASRHRQTHSQSAIDRLGPPPSLPHQHPHALPASISPPAYSQSSAAAHFPDAPSADIVLPPPGRPRALSHNDHDGAVKHGNVLPPLSSLTGPLPLRGDGPMSQTSPQAHAWPPLQPLTSYHPSPGQAQAHRMDSPNTMDLDTSSNSVVSAASPERHLDGRASSVNLDDPDVRLAAEALGDLRADFVSSPPNSNAALPMSPQNSKSSSSHRAQSPVPEPLLALLTTSHPFLATTIGGATSAYGGAKNFSPRFKSSAEYVEGYLTPIANTVGSVGRVTGVEGGVRWFLGGGRRQRSDVEAGGSKKRRKVDENESGSNKRHEAESLKQIAALQPLTTDSNGIHDSSPSTPRGDRRLSMASTVDTLPAYDELRSPEYTEKSQSSHSNAAWQSRLIMSTSGLSVAMSEESLRSLKYCLHWLRWANDHIGRVIGALKTTLEQYERAGNSEMEQLHGSEKDQHLPIVADHVAEKAAEPSRGELAAKINSLKGDVVKTLQDVINTVSKYAGGALPENARVLVRRHLTSLPQRFRVASMSDNAGQGSDADSDSAIREGTRKVLVLAKEGLDMVTQISGVVDGTIVSAEEWCERMGKKKPEEKEGDMPALPPPHTNGDVKMGST